MRRRDRGLSSALPSRDKAQAAMPSSIQRLNSATLSFGTNLETAMVGPPLRADQPPVLSDPHKINLIGGCSVLPMCPTDPALRAGPSRV
jgi:hypothetical protein